MSDRAAVDFDTFKIAFFGTKYFKDDLNREVPFGTELTWRVFRQIEPSSADSVSTAQTFTSLAFWIAVIFVILLALCAGTLLPFWMFLNSLQLIAHLPMIRSNLPSQANYFLLKYLSLVRF